MTVALDLSKRHWTRVRGPLTAVGTWYNAGKQWRPCIAIYRTADELATERDLLIPCIVPLDDAWIYAEEIGDPRRAARATATYARALRLDFAPRSLRDLVTFIVDMLGDLISMPPYQHEAGDIIADVTITNSATGTSREVVLRDV